MLWHFGWHQMAPHRDNYFLFCFSLSLSLSSDLALVSSFSSALSPSLSLLGFLSLSLIGFLSLAFSLSPLSLPLLGYISIWRSLSLFLSLFSDFFISLSLSLSVPRQEMAEANTDVTRATAQGRKCCATAPQKPPGELGRWGESEKVRRECGRDGKMDERESIGIHLSGARAMAHLCGHGLIRSKNGFCSQIPELA